MNLPSAGVTSQNRFLLKYWGDFDGVQTNIQIADSVIGQFLTAQSPVSFGQWLKIGTTILSPFETVFEKGNAGSTHQITINTSGQLRMGPGSVLANQIYTNISTPFNNNTWFYAGYDYQPISSTQATIRAIINGVIVSTKTVNAAPVNANPLMYGSRSGSTKVPYQYQMAEARIWNRILTADEWAAAPNNRIEEGLINELFFRGNIADTSPRQNPTTLFAGSLVYGSQKRLAA